MSDGIMKLMTAGEALELTNTAGERIKRINKELEMIQNLITAESLKGKRQIELRVDPVFEVIGIIRDMGYEYEHLFGRITIHW